MKRRATVGALCVLMLGIVTATPRPAAASPAWSLVASPNNGTHDNILADVSCVSTTSCKAVGNFSNGSAQRTLIESWNGSTWSIVPSPNRGTHDNYLNGVSCVSASSCKAVGYTTDGSTASTLVESWNGSTWSIVPSPNKTANSYLQSVRCVQGTTSCKAVGYYQTGATLHDRTLIESWNGTAWSVVSSPNIGTEGSFLSSVSCVSATSCKAAGTYLNSGGTFRTLIESWNGTTWSIAASPNAGTADSYLYAVSCASATSCKAVGYSAAGTTVPNNRPLIESWNGTAWSLTSSPASAATRNWLQGVTCLSASWCKTVGFLNTFVPRTATESWNGTTWSITATPNHGTGNNYLNRVSCVSATWCKAVGDYESGGTVRTLIVSYG